MKRLDPAALAFHAVALVVVVAACAFLFLSVWFDPPAQPSKVQGMVDRAKAMIEDLAKPTHRPAEPALAKKDEAALFAKSGALSVQPMKPGRRWVYRVTLEPQQWRDAELDYRTAEVANGIAVHTEFRHARGKMNFQLGMFSPNHPSHANTRFPGFFMHAAYLDKPLDVGRHFAWEWPWQLAGGAVREGRVKRYAGSVTAWEAVETPAGRYSAARIETTLSYVDEGRVHATARETLWYAPNAGQVVKVLREGATPDEGFKRIEAQLLALHSGGEDPMALIKLASAALAGLLWVASSHSDAPVPRPEVEAGDSWSYNRMDYWQNRSIGGRWWAGKMSMSLPADSGR